MNTKRRLFVAAPLAAAVLTMAACGSSEPPAKAPGGKTRTVATRVAVVSSMDLTPRLTVDGEVANLYSPDIAAETSGKVLSVHVEPGRSVKKGDLLVRLDTSDLALSAAADRAEQARLAAVAADKEATLKRLQPLAEQDLVSKAALRTATADALAAAEAVKSAAARASLSGRNLDKAEIRAPFDGEVVDRKAVPGAYVRAGDVLLSLVQPKASHIRVLVPESRAGQVKVGMTADVAVAGSESFQSVVTAVRQSASKTSRMVEATVAAPAGVVLRPGSSARVDLLLGEVTGLVVPEGAVMTEGTRAFVYQVVGGAAKRTEVELGARRDGFVELKSGVAGGAEVARDPAFLSEGVKLEVVTEGAK